MTPKETYVAGVLALGGKSRARRLHPWQLARLKRAYAPFLPGASRINTIASANDIEAEARAKNIPEPDE
jgi:hypothetical protein